MRRIVQRCATVLGLDPKRVGYHSLRAGYITASIDAGVPLYRIMDKTGHKSVESMLTYY